MIWLWLFASAALSAIALIATLNALTFPRLRPERPAQQPRVSLLVPARNEAPTISETVRALLAQAYPDFEVIVLDDGSDDGTAQIAREAAVGDSRLRVLPGAPLVNGWLGKPWACHQLAQAASGAWLIFTDADVRWKPDALAALVAQAERRGADMLTVWPTQATVTWAERLTVPLMALVVMGYLPELLVRFAPWSIFAAANGQCVAFRRSAYARVGGHAAVRNAIVEDVALARATKRRGLRLVMLDGNGLITCRMYTEWPSVRDGYAKNILAGHGGMLALMLSTVFHWGIFLAPWLWLATGWMSDLGPHYPEWPLALIALGVGVRALTASATHQRVVDALLMPLSVLLMTAIAVQAVWWQWRYGGPRWKGRRLSGARRGKPQAGGHDE